jgi:hypothetical protein
MTERVNYRPSREKGKLHKAKPMPVIAVTFKCCGGSRRLELTDHLEIPCCRSGSLAMDKALILEKASEK